MIEKRSDADMVLCSRDDTFRTLKSEVHGYFKDCYDSAQLATLDVRLSDATYATPISVMVDGFDGADALGLYHHVRMRFGISETPEFRPRQTQLHTYTFGQAVDSLMQASQAA